MKRNKIDCVESSFIIPWRTDLFNQQRQKIEVSKNNMGIRRYEKQAATNMTGPLSLKLMFCIVRNLNNNRQKIH